MTARIGLGPVSNHLKNHSYLKNEEPQKVMNFLLGKKKQVAYLKRGLSHRRH
jgi:hypothetical protein